MSLLPGLIREKMTQIVQSSMQGRGSDVVEGKLIRKPLARPAWAPAAATMHARSSVRKTVKTRQPSVRPSGAISEPGSLLTMALGRTAPAPPKPKAKSKTVDWVVSESELVTHNGFFKGVDTDNDGLVSGTPSWQMHTCACTTVLSFYLMHPNASARAALDDLVVDWWLLLSADWVIRA